MWLYEGWRDYFAEAWDDSPTIAIWMGFMLALVIVFLVLMYGVAMGAALSGAITLLASYEGGSLVTDIGFVALLAVCGTILGTALIITVAVYKLKLAKLRLDSRELDERLLREARLTLEKEKELSLTGASKRG